MQRNRSGSLCLCVIVGSFAVTASACAAGAGDGTVGGSSALAGSDGDGDDPSTASRATDTGEASNAGDAPLPENAPIWWPTGGSSVNGMVYAADTGKALKGQVLATAPCTGAGCKSTTHGTVIEIVDGKFATKSDAKLTLRPNSAFYIRADGYREIVVAHGPAIKLELEPGRSKPDALPDVYLCRQDASDADHDGICDDAEAKYGTNPNETDTDFDALSDTLELYGHPFAGEPCRGIVSPPGSIDIAQKRAVASVSQSEKLSRCTRSGG